MSDISQYVLELSKYRRTELGQVEELFLLRITRGHTSTYGIFSYLKSVGKPMSYKNVYKRIKRLEQLNLIEVDRIFKRNAIHFKLTNKGLFYILSRGLPTGKPAHPFDYSTDFLIKYRDNVLLKTLLYRYFETATIKNCPIELYHLLSQYLRECCGITLNVLPSLEGREQAEYEPIDRWMASELEWHATSFILKLALKYVEHTVKHIVPTYVNSMLVEYVISIKPGSMKTILCRDRKFMKFLDLATKDVTAGYEELVELSESSNR